MSDARAAHPRVVAHLLTGREPSLRVEALIRLVERLVGDGDRTLMVEELSGEDYTVDHVVDAALTPPFLTDRRIVVARGLDRFKAPELEPLVRYLGDPSPTTSLVLEWTAGRVPKALAEAFKAAGGEKVDTSAPGSARARQGWFEDRVSEADVELDPGARRMLAEHLGEDVGRLAGVLSTLSSVYGPGSRLGVAQIRPYLGEAGSAPPWDLTDAIDAGRRAEALGVLARMLDAGERHPLQILASLANHYERILRLDGAGVADEKAAAARLGLKGSTFPARKALTQSRRLGHQGVARAVTLLSEADLAVKGRSALDPRTVVEILVARLAAAPRRR